MNSRKTTLTKQDALDEDPEKRVSTKFKQHSRQEIWPQKFTLKAILGRHLKPQLDTSDQAVNPQEWLRLISADAQAASLDSSLWTEVPVF